VTSDDRRRLLNRLKRVAGQIRGIEAMVKMSKDPTAVLGQITAARAALAKVEQQLLRDHIERSASGDAGQAGEALQALLDLLEGRGRRE
jgi:DNA-binding FrmR family transcriptional regulator